MVDWGYFARGGQFRSTPNPDNTKDTSGIGAVTVTPGDVSDGSFAAGGTSYGTFTFNDGASPTAGAAVNIGDSFGNWAGSEDNGAAIVFNGLGAGSHTVTFYAGHDSSGSTGRDLRVRYDLAADGTNFTGSDSTATTAGSSATHGLFVLQFSTTDASADLTLTLDSLSGSSGSGWLGGYIVETVPIPEPSNMALLSLGGLVLILRRRK